MIDIFSNLDILTVGIAVALIGILAVVIFFNNKKSITSRTFLYFSIVTIIWGIINYTVYSFTSTVMILWLTRFLMFSAVWQAFFFLQLFKVFPEENFSFSYRYKFILIPIVFITSMVTLTPIFFKKIILYTPGTAPIFEKGPGLILFALVAIGMVIEGIWYLIKKTIKISANKRQPFILIFIGTLLTFSLIIILNFILPSFFNNVDFIPLGALFMFPFIFFTSYAISKYKLFNIKILSTEVFSLLLLLITFFEITFVKSLVELFFRILIFIAFFVFSILLIKSVIKEVKQNEQLEKLSKKLKMANINLQKLDQQKSDFLDIASHQLRTPLSALIGLLSMQYDGDFESLSKQEKKEQQKNMLISADRLKNIVHDLMDAMEVEMGAKLRLVPTDINKLVEEAIKILQPKYDKKNIFLKYIVSSKKLPKIQADPLFLSQVFINLIDNAYQYTDKGGVKINLFVENNSIVFEIIDTGIGITLEEKEKLFNKFVRSKRAMLVCPDGSGLGLFIAKKIVELHGGKIEIISAGKSKGTTFKVYLPIKS